MSCELGPGRRGNVEPIENLTDIYQKWENLVPAEAIPQLKEFVRDIFATNPYTEADFQKAMCVIRRKYRRDCKKAHLLHVYDLMRKSGELPSTWTKHLRVRMLFTKKRVKSHSGVISVTVFTSPYPKVGKKVQRFSCKWNCYYCPNEPGQPRSYLHDEPGVLRANRNHFDPVLQFHDRAVTLAMNGHPIDKIEILVLGGTWSSYPHEYQETFIRDIFYAANTFWDRDKPHRGPLSLAQEQAINESARSKIIGLTLETRPDCIDAVELRRFRHYGCTRVQLGIQHTDDGILKLVNRGHGVQASIDGIRRLLDSGFKVDGHFMPDLPGSNPAKDWEMFRYVLESDDIRVDQMKLYPHAVVPWTITKKWLDSGKFKPYAQDELVELLVKFKSQVHPWIRLNRVVRDIPGHYISGGNQKTNLRQDLMRIMKERHLHCDCIRCREVRLDRSQIGAAELVVRRYGAGGGTEYFISFETRDRRTIFGFLRLRITDSAGSIPHKAQRGTAYVRLDGSVSNGVGGGGKGGRVEGCRNNDEEPEQAQAQEQELVFPELRGAALVRELHVYGQLMAVPGRAGGRGGGGNNNDNDNNNTKVRGRGRESQHTGFGTRLMRYAEHVAELHGRTRMAVIAGVGTRGYYRRLGYTKSFEGGEFMVQEIEDHRRDVSCWRPPRFVRMFACVRWARREWFEFSHVEDGPWTKRGRQCALSRCTARVALLVLAGVLCLVIGLLVAFYWPQ